MFSSIKKVRFLFALALINFSCVVYGAELPGTKSSAQSLYQTQKLRTYNFASDRLLVRFKKSSTIASKTIASHAKVGSKVMRHFSLPTNLELVKLPPGKSVKQAMAEYRKDPNVLYVEPDYIVTTAVEPDDSSFSSLWGMNNTGQTGGTTDADINAPEAWDLTTGSANTIVAVIDSGLDYTHPDLAANMWTNPGEIPGNGVDDDLNGYIDDVHGINAITGSGDPMDDQGHGTHVSGTIGAVGNNAQGVVGVNWTVRIIGCKFLDSAGSGNTSDAIECLNYLLALKTRTTNPVDILLSNNSWGGGPFSQSLSDAIATHRDQGILFVAAAGNGGLDGIGDDNDLIPFYPSSYELANVIAVAATDHNDALASFSNFGRHSVDVGAPGVNILSTVPTGICTLCNPSGYRPLNGTSMATPHVAGLAALLDAQDPTRSPFAIRNIILSSGQSIPALAGITLTGKRIRAADTNGVGALTCSNQALADRLSPTANIVSMAAGDTLALTYLNIACDQGVGSVQVTINPGGTILTLLDDGQGTDEVAGDGVYSANFTATVPATLTFPGNDVVTINMVTNYAPPTQPTFSYRNITGTALLNLSNLSAVGFTTPFPIHYGGRSYNFIWVNNDGYIIFGFNNHVFNFPNPSLPLATASNVIAPLWDGLNPDLAGGAFHQVLGTTPNREFVVEWRGIPHEGGSDPVTFQVVFFEGSSDVLFNYADVDFGNVAFDNGASATVGVQVTSTLAQQFSFNTASLTDSMALLWVLSNLVANAGPDQTVNFSATVNLDGTGSSDSNGTIVSYSWVQTAGTGVTLDDPTIATPSFTAPSTAGVLTFELTVTDNDGATDTDTVEVTVNAPPVANAGVDHTVNFGVTVNLDGTGSSDSDGTITSYSWTQTAGTTVTLNNTNTATPSFSAPLTAGVLTFQLTVTDNDGNTDSDSVNVTVNTSPTANAGPDQSVNFSDTVILDGTGSSDNDGTITSYSWTQTAGTTVTLNNANTATSSFSAPSTAGVLTFQLTVTDSDGATDTDTVDIAVNAPNVAPFANAGVDQTVNFGDIVNLDGTGSSDSDGTITSYSWTQTAGTTVTLNNANTATPSFSAPSTAGVLTFQLTVTDNDGATDTDTVDVTVNAPPLANAGVDQTINFGDTVNLDGTGSSDSDGTIVNYSWVQTVGTVVTLNNANSATPSFTAPSSAETLTFQLTVTDNDGATDTDTVDIVVGSPGGGGGGGGGCTLNTNAPFDPGMPILLSLGALYFMRRRKSVSMD